MIDLTSLTDDDLEQGLMQSVFRERAELLVVLAHLAEFDRRRLAIGRGHPSLFEYCTTVLGFSEGGAMRRINAARAAAEYPRVDEALRSGRISLMSVALLYRILNQENHQRLLRIAEKKTTREVEFLVQSYQKPASVSQSDPRAIELLPPMDSALPSSAIPFQPRTVVKPISGDSARVAFTADSEILTLLDRAADLLRHRVFKRDGGRCTFEVEGRRCPATGMLQFDHMIPWSRGGASNDPENIRLLCAAHNRLAAEQMDLARPG